MELKFLSQLTQEEIVELVNYCSTSFVEEYGKDYNVSFLPLVDRVEIETCIDEFYTPYMLVKSYLGNLHFNDYIITDYSIKAVVKEIYKREEIIPLEKYLIRFLSLRFKKDYIDTLYEFRLLQLEMEITELFQLESELSRGKTEI